MTGLACEMHGIEKAFGPNRVLRGVDLDLPAGTVTVLMGANGAGKSTLVKILCGAHRADGGAISLFGQPYRADTPAEAFAKGVVTVHQSIDDGVVPDLDVASNLMLDRLAAPGAGFFVSDRALRREAEAVARRMGLDVPVTAPVAQLGVADRQMIAIARAMAREPKVLILDEPTSSLSSKEAARLFELIGRLRETGVAILYISHRMSDIRAVADRIVVMRDGLISGVFEDPTETEAAVQAMLGHAMTDTGIARAAPGAPVLRLEGVRLRPGAPAFDLDLRAGEVVAVCGLLGSGKTRLASILFGLATPAAGRMSLDGAPYAPADPGAAIRAGVHLSPKDRATNGIVQGFDITRNTTLPFLDAFSTASILNRRRQRETTDRMIGTLGVVCRSNADDIGTLSGGNQQKVVVGRWLSSPCRVLVLDEPFQGVDIRARRDIGAHLRATAAERATLVLVAEIDEALEIADRIVVLPEHGVGGEHLAGEVDTTSLMADVAGQSDTARKIA